MISVEETVLRDAARTAGLKAHDACHLHDHATAIYLLPSEQVVARITQGTMAGDAAELAVPVTHWLIRQGFPATAPAAVEQPIHLGDHVVTFWYYYPQGQRARPAPFHLGILLRQLHDLPSPPTPLPPYVPLTT
ncbi:MAG: hypothetical protein ACRDQ5_04135, partial [Sciscionella sp.]